MGKKQVVTRNAVRASSSRAHAQASLNSPHRTRRAGSNLNSGGKNIILRCRPLAMTKFYKEKLEAKLSQQHFEKLNKLLYFHLFQMPPAIVSPSLFRKIFDCFYSENGEFEIAGVPLNFTNRDVALAIGLCEDGTFINMYNESGKRRRIGQSDHQIKLLYFPEENDRSDEEHSSQEEEGNDTDAENVEEEEGNDTDAENVEEEGNEEENRRVSKFPKSYTYMYLENKLKDLVDKEDKVDDFVTLLVLYILTMFLLPNSSGCVDTSLIPIAAKYEEHPNIAWASVVHKAMMQHMKAACKEKKDGTKSICIGGCALAVIVWFYEKCQPRSVLAMSGGMPRYYNWHLNKRFSNESADDFFAKLSPGQINTAEVEILKQPELKMVSEGFSLDMIRKPFEIFTGQKRKRAAKPKLVKDVSAGQKRKRAAKPKVVKEAVGKSGKKEKKCKKGSTSNEKRSTEGDDEEHEENQEEDEYQEVPVNENEYEEENQEKNLEKDAEDSEKEDNEENQENNEDKDEEQHHKKNQDKNEKEKENEKQTTGGIDDSVASNWIDDILRNHSHLNQIVVGLDVEWCPNGFYGTTGENPAALLQLCVSDRCLIFQLIHSDYIPAELSDFFFNNRLNFVGVGVKGDFKMLEKDYGLYVRSCVNELGDLAAERTGWELMRKWGLQKLLLELRGMQLQKPKSICLSNWGSPLLTPAQIEYAALDAFASFDLGWHLIFDDSFL